MTGRVRRAALAAVLAALAVTARADATFIGETQVSAAPDLGAPPWRVTLVLNGARADKLGELRARFGAVELEADRARFAVRGYAAGTGPVGPADRAASFSVDFDEPPVQRLRAEVVKAAGETPRAADLTRFVAGWITRKSLARGLDPASVVARRREGDCTEHAVLLAALARMFGIPARVVNGFALVQGEGGLRAFGHAWVEVHEGGAWRLADASGVEALAPVYLPIQTARDEGPSMGLLVSGDLGVLNVRAIEVAPER